MSVAAGILAVIGGAAVLDHLSTSKHDRLLKKTYNTASWNTSSNTDVYTDHIDPRKAAGNANGVVDGIEGIPDLVIHDFPTNLIVEVEDAEGLKRPQRVIDQLDGFSKQGAKRILVVPDAEETLTVGNEIAAEVDGTVTVETPKSLASHC